MVHAALEVWIGTLLKDFGNDLFRYKGILHVKGMDRKFVFQGVHMLFNGKFTNKWRVDETRQNKFVFIGRNLPVERLEAEFKGLFAPETLRFPIGSKVLAKVKGYQPATVIAHWDQGNPYRLRLTKNLDEVWAPIDEDDYIRAAVPE